MVTPNELIASQVLSLIGGSTGNYDLAKIWKAQHIQKITIVEYMYDSNIWQEDT